MEFKLITKDIYKEICYTLEDIEKTEWRDEEEKEWRINLFKKDFLEMFNFHYNNIGWSIVNILSGFLYNKITNVWCENMSNYTKYINKRFLFDNNKDYKELCITCNLKTKRIYGSNLLYYVYLSTYKGHIIYASIQKPLNSDFDYHYDMSKCYKNDEITNELYLECYPETEVKIEDKLVKMCYELFKENKIKSEYRYKINSVEKIINMVKEAEGYDEVTKTNILQQSYDRIKYLELLKKKEIENIN